ncbi:MAG: hypothetical protein CL946_13615 [Ectothiorhodospiraceae bacterium]|nr:hypothetical protein [Ectothiorhodospiraceae bacterium]
MRISRPYSVLLLIAIAGLYCTEPLHAQNGGDSHLDKYFKNKYDHHYFGIGAQFGIHPGHYDYDESFVSFGLIARGDIPLTRWDDGMTLISIEPRFGYGWDYYQLSASLKATFNENIYLAAGYEFSEFREDRETYNYDPIYPYPYRPIEYDLDETGHGFVFTLGGGWNFYYEVNVLVYLNLPENTVRDYDPLTNVTRIERIEIDRISFIFGVGTRF